MGPEILLVAGGVLVYFRSKNKQKAALMGQTETSNASDSPGLAPGRWPRSGDAAVRGALEKILSQNEQFAPFSVEDDTGSVPVNAEGAEVDADQVVNRFERGAPGLEIAGILVRFGEGERTLGYRYTESILPVDAPVYVLGTVQEGGGIGAPQPRDKSSGSSSATAPKKLWARPSCGWVWEPSARSSWASSYSWSESSSWRVEALRSAGGYPAR